MRSAIAVAFAFAVTVGLAAQDRRLVYELPIDALQRSWREQPDTTIERELARYAAVVAARAGAGITVTRDGASRLVVTVPAARIDELPRLRRRIEAAGKLEFRIVASAEAGFDLDAERERLQRWLDAGGRARVLADPRALEAFHVDADQGAVAAGELRWVPHHIGRDTEEPARWDRPLADAPLLTSACVRAFDEAQWNGGFVPEGDDAPRELVEFVALDLVQRGFTHEDLDLDEVRVQHGLFAGVRYRLQEASIAAYSAWSGQNVGRCCAIVWNGSVTTAPRFESAIPGVGWISTGPSAEQAEDVADVLRAGALPLPPRLVE